MNVMEEESIKKLIILLKDKFDKEGQDVEAYLEGLLHADYLNYWDYIQADILLNLQRPRTNLPDELIFISYHQITELYFKLIIHAIKQVTSSTQLKVAFFIKQLKRINAYLDHLIHSFDIMIDGIDREQFLKFRTALLPSSGFQSAQYRMIEIYSTDIENLVAFEHRKKQNVTTDADYLSLLYWKQGAIERSTGEKTLTLRQLEDRYDSWFAELSASYKTKNLLKQYQNLSEIDRNNKTLVKELRNFDIKANIKWPMSHLKVAAKHLKVKEKDLKATGGTNWRKYLPPMQRRVSFFPELFTVSELEKWQHNAYNIMEDK